MTMKFFTPAMRISIGLVIVMISILVLAQALGLAPSADKTQLDARKNLAESLSNQVALTITRNDDVLLKDFLDSTVEHNPEILSAAVRRNDGLIVAQTSQHEHQWEKAIPGQSTPTHIRIPLLINGNSRAMFEVSFHPLPGERHPLFHIPTFIVLVIFLSISGFVGFWFYIKRTLKHLDPSAVVPARVRNAMNILAEGVLIMDRREQIVLANSVIVECINRSEQNLLGKKASALGWVLASDQESKVLPWIDALQNRTKQVGVRVLLKNKDNQEKIFSVNAVPIMDGVNSLQGVIAVFDDVSELEEKSRLLEDMIKQLALSQSAIEVKNKELLNLSVRDPLTDCYNRRALYEHLDKKYDGARVSDAEYSCIMLDIDHFKRVNDTYGHHMGDEVIKMVARTIHEVVRDVDLVARFGGEEFCVVLPGASLAQAVSIAERCREKIAHKACGDVSVTSSFGVTSKRQGAKTPNDLIHQADEALYYSKHHGRNKVTSWADIHSSASTVEL